VLKGCLILCYFLGTGANTSYTSVDELASVHALCSNEELVALLVLVGVAEYNAGKRGTTTGIVDNLFDYTLKVSMAL